MWFNILKNELASKTGFSQLDFDNIVLEDDDCKRWLKGLYEIYEELYDLGFYCLMMGREPLVWKDDEITEDVACQIKEYLETQPYPMTVVYGRKGIITDNIYISYYVEDYFEFSIAFAKKGENLTNPSLRMHFGSSLRELTSPYDETEQDVYDGKTDLKKYYDGFKRICKYIGNESMWDKFKARLDIFGDW